MRTREADLKRTVLSRDAAGRPQETEELVARRVKLEYWTDTSRQTNQNDKFIDQAIGSAVLSNKHDIDTTMVLEIDGVKHYIIGVDEFAGYGTKQLVSWRREHER